MSKLAFIFPGQGAQKAGMGKDFYENSEAARSFFDQAQKILDFDLKEMCFGEHEELNFIASSSFMPPAAATAAYSPRLKPAVMSGLMPRFFSSCTIARQSF